MLNQQLIHTLKHHQTMDAEFTKNLQSIIEEYPFFSTAQLLLTKALFQQNSIQYSKQLKKTAIVANSRSVLYELIHQPIAESSEPKVEDVVEAGKTVEPKISEAPVVEIVVNTNPVTISNPDIKIVYVNTIASEPKIAVPQPIVVKEPELVELPNKELDIIKAIENESDKLDDAISAKEKTVHSLELEISKGIINSYVETDIIKTPQLEKEVPKEPVSFTDWLNKVKKESHTIQKQEVKQIPVEPKAEPKQEEKAATTEKPVAKSAEIEQKRQIIDKLIDLDPGRIKLSNTKFFSSSVDAKQGLLENEHLVTETLAKIYALQGNISKAIRAYEILSLKFPQKSVYFATLIEKLKTNK